LNGWLARRNRKDLRPSRFRDAAVPHPALPRSGFGENKQVTAAGAYQKLVRGLPDYGRLDNSAAELTGQFTTPATRRRRQEGSGAK
jgi:hypothetical protein